MDGSLRQLQEDGYAVLDNVFSTAELEMFAEKFNLGWSEVRQQLPGLRWKRRQYKDSAAPTFFLGRALYQGRLVTEYEGTEVIDMCHGRYDFTFGLDDLAEAILSNPKIHELLSRELGRGYSGYIGGLPVEPNAGVASAGYWHRDSYSLFEDESIDLGLPSFYFTMMIPLADVEEGNGATEFVPGSHKVNFTQTGVSNVEMLLEWVASKAVVAPTVRAGSACIFNGLTLHRGGSNNSLNPRNALYMVFKKNWYSDEDPRDYEDEEP